MRLLMGISKNRHGTYYAVKQVPVPLQGAVARVLNNGKAHQVWLKRSLGTKDGSEANRRAKVVLIEFDRILERAKELLADRPLRTSLNQSEIDRMADYFFATILSSDERMRQEGFDPDALTTALIEKGFLPEEVSGMMISDPAGARPKYGLSDSELSKHAASWEVLMLGAEQALAKGDIWQVQDAISEVQEVFGINVDPDSAAYRQLGLAFLKQFVKAVRAIEQRNAGKWTETPPLPAPNAAPPIEQGKTTPSLAFEGWKRARNRSPRTAQEYEYAIKLFGELYGDMPLAAIRKTQARQFRQALQDVPIKRFRIGKLLTATLPELAAWGREHPDAQKIGAATINKLLGALQSIGRWARKEDLVPEEWADPFADMRLDEDESERAQLRDRAAKLIGVPLIIYQHIAAYPCSEQTSILDQQTSVRGYMDPLRPNQSSRDLSRSGVSDGPERPLQEPSLTVEAWNLAVESVECNANSESAGQYLLENQEAAEFQEASVP